jgi:cytoskeleton-associated protein 5
MQTIDKEFEKVEGQAAPTPIRTQEDVSPAPQTNGKAKAGGDPVEELYPRVEIDRLLVGTPILANAKSDAWKSRKEALEQLQGLLEANKRFKPTMGTRRFLRLRSYSHSHHAGDISQVLKSRIPDTNKAVQALALDVIARIAAGMNKPFEKYTRLYAVPIATVLADQKAPIRASAKATLTAIATACEGPESLVSGLASALEAQNPLQRSELLSWLSEWFKDHPPPPSLDLSSFASPVVACLDDKNGDVRKGAQSVLPFLMPSVGYDALVKETNNLKPASRSTVLPILQALKAANLATAPTLSNRPEAQSQARAAPSRAQQAPSPAAAPESEPERAGSRVAPKSKPGLGLKRPATSAPPTAAPSTPVSHASPSGTPPPFTTSNPDAKRNRLSKDAGRWTIESGPVRKDLADFLQTQMEPHVSRDISQSLFSHDHNAVNDWIAGMTVIADCYNHTLAGDERYGPTNESMRAILVANSDLALKYSCLRVHENQSNLVSKALDLLEAVVALLAEENYRLGDAEAACFVPTFVHKVSLS